MRQTTNQIRIPKSSQMIDRKTGTRTEKNGDATLFCTGCPAI
jgi:hypothetical protein